MRFYQKHRTLDDDEALLLISAVAKIIKKNFVFVDDRKSMIPKHVFSDTVFAELNCKKDPLIKAICRSVVLLLGGVETWDRTGKPHYRFVKYKQEISQS
jgi:hypothetical protein